MPFQSKDIPLLNVVVMLNHQTKRKTVKEILHYLLEYCDANTFKIVFVFNYNLN